MPADASAERGRCLVLGLGNDILRDDRIGLAVVRGLGGVPEGVVVREAAIGGMGLVEVFEGFDRGLIVDADQSGAVPPGTVRHMVLGPTGQNPSLRSAHDADLPTSLELARRLGWHVPAHIDVVAIEVQDAITFDEQMTPAVEAALPEAIQLVRRLLELEPED